jgi:hypothetical protein
MTPQCMTCEHLKHSIARILRLRWRMHWLATLLAEYNRRCLAPTKTTDKKETETA